MCSSSSAWTLEYVTVLLKRADCSCPFVWNALIRAYEQSHQSWKAIEFYNRMVQNHVFPDKFTFPFILKACAGASAFKEGQRIHCRILKSPINLDLYVKNSLIFMYARCGNMDDARASFDFTLQKDLISWNTLIDGYVKHDKILDAANLFYRMPKRDLFSWNVMIDGYSKCGQIESARKLFDEMTERDVVSWNSMLDAYAKRGNLEAARMLFDQTPYKNEVTWGVMLKAFIECAHIGAAHCWFEKIPHKSLITWNCLINGYVKCSDILSAQRLFDIMTPRSLTTWNIMLEAHANNGNIELAYAMFQSMSVKDDISWNIIIDGYASAGRMDVARAMFDTMPCRDIVSWNTMISGYKNNGDPKKAVGVYFSMPLFREKPNCFTLAVVLSAIGDLGFLMQGKEVHKYVDRCRVPLDGIVGVALIDMYSKCGFIDIAMEIFRSISHKIKDHWNAMMSGLAMHGYGKVAVSLFQDMELSSVLPDDVTFVALLNACSHSGLVDEGYFYFHNMRSNYGLTPKIQHYGCMVDLLSRAGHLMEAVQLVRNMPVRANDVVWRALLGASRNHCDLDVAEHAATQLIQLVPQDSSSYVLLANIYGYKGKSESSRDIWKVMKERGIVKSPGSSSIEVQGTVHEFIARDTSHPEAANIHLFLINLTQEMLVVGYAPDLKQSLYETSA